MRSISLLHIRGQLVSFTYEVNSRQNSCLVFPTSIRNLNKLFIICLFYNITGFKFPQICIFIRVNNNDNKTCLDSDNIAIFKAIWQLFEIRFQSYFLFLLVTSALASFLVNSNSLTK